MVQVDAKELEAEGRFMLDLAVLVELGLLEVVEVEEVPKFSGAELAM